MALKYLHAVRMQIGLRAFVAWLVVSVVTAAIAFCVWINREGISLRSGIYLLLASADVYYIQPEMVKVSTGRFRVGAPELESPDLK